MTTGRPIQFDPALALDQAQQLFWRKGYSDTSLADLLLAMGLSKSSFYQAFHSKQDLFEKSLRHYMGDRASQMRQKLADSPSPRVFIKSMLYGVAESPHDGDVRKGCLVMNTACEFAQSDTQIAGVVSESIESFSGVFKQAVIEGQKQGEIATNKNSQDIAAFLVCTLSGLNTAFKAGATQKSIMQTADIALAALD